MKLAGAPGLTIRGKSFKRRLGARVVWECVRLEEKTTSLRRG